MMNFIDRRALLALFAAPLLAGCGTLMPSAEQPYTLGHGLTAAPATSWKWVDARVSLDTANRSTAEGLRFGEPVLRPSTFDFVQAELARAVMASEHRVELQAKLAGKTLRLLEFDASAGLRVRLSQQQVGNWDVMRARLVVEIDGTRYEAADVHTFNNSDRPSPLSPAVINAIANLVRQIHIF